MNNRYPQLSAMLEQMKGMHTKFGINYEGEPRLLSDEEKQFRFEGMNEEVIEFKDAQTLEEQFDALLDNAVFTFSTAERMGLLPVFEEGFTRVMNANCAKELGPNNKRGGFSIDLRKPEGWQAPVLTDLVQPIEKVTGIIVLEGPDASGKTTLANKIKSHVEDAEIIHLTWSKELEPVMNTYQLGLLHHAISMSKEKLVIIDRLWLSELVYSEVFRGGTKYPSLYKDCLHLLDKTNHVHVLCLPQKDSWKYNYHKMCEERNELYAKDERMEQVHELYAAMYCGLMCRDYTPTIENFILKNPLNQMSNVIHYDFTLDSEVSIITQTILHLKGE